MKLKQYNILLIVPLLFCSLLLTPNSYDFQQSVKETKIIQTEIETYNLKMELDKQTKELSRLKKVIVIYKHYRDCGTLYDCYWITPEHLYKCIILGEKYRPIMKHFNWDSLNPENMYLCYLANGFNYKADANNKGTNKNNSIDWGICDLNDCNLWRLPDKGKGNDKYNMELSIKAWHEYMEEQKEYSCWWFWSHFRKDVQKLYFQLQKIK